MASTKREYFYGIDVVRFGAALMVMVFHLGRSVNGPGSRGFSITEGRVGTSFADLLGWGSVGVQIFFVVSGLVIANSANGSSPFAFLRSRAERLYPATWICATISLLVWLVNGRTSALRDLLVYAKSVALIPFGPWIDAPYWTLGHEIVFYAVIFAVLVAGRIRDLERVASGIALICGGYWAMRGWSALGGGHLALAGLLDKSVLRMFFPVFGCYFALGMFIWLHRHAGLGWLGRICAALAFVSCFAPYLLAVLAGKGLDGSFYALAIGIAAVLVSAFRPSDRSRENGWQRWLRKAGLATFPLYLLHFALGAYLMRQLVDRGVGADAAFALVVPVIVVAAFVIASGPERAVRRLVSAGFDWLARQGGTVGGLVRSLSRPNVPIAPLGSTRAGMPVSEVQVR